MSKRIKIIVPTVLGESTRAMMEAQLPAHLIRPEYSVEFVGSSRLTSLAVGYYDMAIMDMIVLEAGMRSEQEGFDAVCINTMSDSALYPLRSRLAIPVVSPGQTAFLTACMLGHKFSVITMWDNWRPLYRKTLAEYGLAHRLASVRTIDTRPDLQALLEGKEDVVFPRLEEQARIAMERDGADVIILGSTTMHQSHQFLSQALPVPVINPGVVAYKMCELLLEVGLSHSKAAFFSPEQIQDDRLFPAG